MQQQETHPLRCPSCRKGRVADAATKQNSDRLKLLPPERAAEAECFVKCPKCGSQIGIAFISR